MPVGGATPSMRPMPKIPLPAVVLRLPLQWLPDALHTELLARALNHLLRGQRLTARLPELDGRSVCVDIRDAGSKLHFRIHGTRLLPAWPGPSLVTIRGELRDFVALATRTEDADTLFFHRRLSIEGDTETGLHVKNLLDSLHYDWETHVRAVLPASLAATAIGLMHRLRSVCPLHRA